MSAVKGRKDDVRSVKADCLREGAQLLAVNLMGGGGRRNCLRTAVATDGV